MDGEEENLDLHHLNYFIEVARQGSFTRAGQALHVSQPTISKMVKDLEDELGVILFDRTTKQVRLTDAGKVVLRQAQQISKSFHNLSAELADLMKIQKGNIRIGLPPMVGANFFTGVLTRFHELYPLITIEIIEAGAQAIEQGVEDSSLDIGVAVLPVDEKVFNFFSFVKEDLKLIVNPGHYLAVKSNVSLLDLKEVPFILFREDFTLHYRIREECLRLGFMPRVVCESSQWDFISGLVAANFGVALLPETICKKLDASRIKIISLEESIPWHLGIIWRKDKYQSFAAREWIRFTLSIL